MFERYNESARRTLFYSRYEASQLGSVSIEVGHLLLGLLGEGEGLTSRLFARAGLTRDEVVKAACPESRGPATAAVEIPFSQQSKNALQFAAQESDRLLHDYIGPEHLLLGLLRVDASAAAGLLNEKGLSLAAVREEIVSRSSTAPPGQPPVPPSGMFPSQYSPPGAADHPPSYDVHISPSSRTEQQGTSRAGGPAFWTAAGFTLKQILGELFQTHERLIELPASLDTGRYDVVLRLPAPEPAQAMEARVQQGLATHFGVRIFRQPRSMAVYVVTAPDGEARLQRVDFNHSGGGFAGGTLEFATLATDGGPPTRLPGRDEWTSFGEWAMSGTMDDVCRSLEEIFDRLIVNETNLTGMYDVAVHGQFSGIEQFLDALKDQTGLVATPAQRTVTVLVVRQT